MQVVELVQDKAVGWEIISAHPAQSPASSWTGTRISFALAERDNPGTWMGIASEAPSLTVLDFRHSGWDEQSPYFGFCTTAWGETLVLLRHHCESP